MLFYHESIFSDFKSTSMIFCSDFQVPASWGKGGGVGEGKGRGQHARSYLKKNPYIFALKFPYSKMNFEYTASPSNFDIDNQTFMIPYTPPPPPAQQIRYFDYFWKNFLVPPSPHIPPHHIQSRRYVPALLVANSYMNMYISY